MNIISDYTATATIHAAFEKIDLTRWLFTLKDHEYQACSAAHLACGASLTEDGKRISLNVERVGGNLLIQHYIEEISLRDHCRVNSHTNSLSPAGDTRLDITWEIRVQKLSGTHCEFLNRVIVRTTEEFAALLKQANITDFEPMRARMTENVMAHNEEETPRFAHDIECKALAGTWVH